MFIEQFLDPFVDLFAWGILEASSRPQDRHRGIRHRLAALGDRGTGLSPFPSLGRRGILERAGGIPLKMLPSELFKRQVYGTFSRARQPSRWLNSMAKTSCSGRRTTRTPTASGPIRSRLWKPSPRRPRRNWCARSPGKMPANLYGVKGPPEQQQSLPNKAAVHRQVSGREGAGSPFLVSGAAEPASRQPARRSVNSRPSAAPKTGARRRGQSHDHGQESLCRGCRRDYLRHAGRRRLTEAAEVLGGRKPITQKEWEALYRSYGQAQFTCVRTSTAVEGPIIMTDRPCAAPSPRGIAAKSCDSA